MHFAEGLRAYRCYQTSDRPADLEHSASEFDRAVTFYPQDALPHFYFALIRLEQVSALDRPAGGNTAAAGNMADSAAAVIADRNTSTQRESWIQDALLHFEQYQAGRQVRDSNDGWLYLWSEYNRAAAQVHKLNPRGYLRARGILFKHLDDQMFHHAKQLNSIPDEAPQAFAAQVPAEPGTSLELNQELFQSQTLTSQLRSLWEELLAKNGARASARRRRREMARIRRQVNRKEFYGLLLQMESLLNLTRTRPLREAESIRQAGVEGLDVGAEPVEIVADALNRLVTRIDEFVEKEQITRQAERDLRSDYWSQRGHLECAKALARIGVNANSIRLVWPKLDDPLDNRLAFRVLVRPRLSDVRPLIEEASCCFRTALSFQPRWVPALKSRDEMEALLR